MSLVTQIEEEVRDAMRARDTERRDALRLILSSLKSAEKDLLRPLSEDEELQVLQRERKKRTEAADAFHAAGRDEQADRTGGGRPTVGRRGQGRVVARAAYDVDQVLRPEIGWIAHVRLLGRVADCGVDALELVELALDARRARCARHALELEP